MTESSENTETEDELEPVETSGEGDAVVTAKKAGRPKGAKNKPDAISKFQRMMAGRRESDLFVGQKSSTKYVIERLKPEWSASGRPLKGYLNTHFPPFDLDQLRARYGGGTYNVKRIEGAFGVTNDVEFTIAGDPKEPEGPPAAAGPPTAPQAPGAAAAPAPSNLSELVSVAATLARAMQPPAPPPAPSVKEQLETLILIRDAADGFGGRERPVGEGLAGIVQAIPPKFFENVGEALLNFSRNFGSKAAVPEPSAPLPQTNGNVNEKVTPHEWEPLAAALKSAVLAGVQTGSPSPDELAAELLSMKQAEPFAAYLDKVDAPSILAWIRGKVGPKTQKLMDHPDVRKYLIATLQAARAKRREAHAKPTPP